MRFPALQALTIFILGILLFIQLPVPSLALMFLAIIATSVAVIYNFIGKKSLSQLALCFAILFSAGFCTGLRVREFPSNHIIHFTGFNSQLTISGEIVSEPDIRPNKTFLKVRVDSLEYLDSKIRASGNIRVSIKEATSQFNYHDQIEFSGFLNSPSSGRNIGAFDYRKYLQLRNIFGIIGVESAERIKLLHSGRTDPFVRGIITPVRNYISNVYDRYLQPEQSAVMKGFLIGNTRFIPKEVYQKFKDTGTLHVLAVSGANVGFVIFTLYLFLSLFKMPRYHRNIIAIIAVLLFSFLAYNQPSVVRASVMAIIALTGRLLYRDLEPLNIISFSALLILAFRPLYIFDLGFQLSYAAAFGLIIMLPKIIQLFPKPKGLVKKSLRYFLMIFSSTVIAQISVIPILIYYFYKVPMVSFLSNLVVVPLVGFATTLGILLVFISGIPFLAYPLGNILDKLIEITLTSIDYFYQLPIPNLRFAAPDIWMIIIYYIIVLLIFAIFSNRNRVLSILLVLFVISNVLIWKNVIAANRFDLKIDILDVYSGSAILVEESNGSRIAINGGGCYDKFNRGEMIFLPFLHSQGIRKIDHLKVTSLDEDNIQSLISTISGLKDLSLNVAVKLEADSLIYQKIEKIDPFISISSNKVRLNILPEYVPVQKLNSKNDLVSILICHWDYLITGELEQLVLRLQPETVIILNYPNRYDGYDLLDRFREQFQWLELFSTLENGGIQIKIVDSKYQVLIHSDN